MRYQNKKNKAIFSYKVNFYIDEFYFYTNSCVDLNVNFTPKND